MRSATHSIGQKKPVDGKKRLKRTSPNDHIDRLTFQDHLIIADFNCAEFGQIPHT